MKSFRHFHLLLLLIAATPFLTLAQENGSITGQVTDSSGAIVPKAQAIITNTATGVTQSITANEQGLYSFLSLPVGGYDLQVTAPGFAKFEQHKIVLNTTDQLRIDVVLQVGQLTEPVEVSSSAVHVETENTQLGDVITGSHIEAMPLNGRQFTDLLGLQAGVVPQQSVAYGSLLFQSVLDVGVTDLHSFGVPLARMFGSRLLRHEECKAERQAVLRFRGQMWSPSFWG